MFMACGWKVTKAQARRCRRAAGGWTGNSAAPRHGMSWRSGAKERILSAAQSFGHASFLVRCGRNRAYNSAFLTHSRVLLVRHIDI